VLDGDLFPLVLKQIGDGKDEVLILDVIAAGSQGMAGEGEKVGAYSDDCDRVN